MKNEFAFMPGMNSFMSDFRNFYDPQMESTGINDKLESINSSAYIAYRLYITLGAIPTHLHYF